MHKILLIVIALLSLPAYAQDISGVAHIHDGDSLFVSGIAVELWGMDAPETGQECTISGVVWRCGIAATEHLKTFVGSHTVSCKQRGKTADGGIIAKCAVGSLDLGAEMIEVGLAIPHWPTSEKYYLRSYKEARGLDRGMHKGTFIEPWEWRRQKGL